MSDFKPLYRYSFSEAKDLDEQEQWQESFTENKRCRDFIDDLVKENFDGLKLKGDIPQKVIAEFGFDRTRWVFANHIQYYDYDGRISPQNKVWASEIRIPHPSKEMRDHNIDLLLNSHNTLVDYLAGKVQQMYVALNLYDHRHRVQSETPQDYTGKLLILRADILKESFRTPENQLFLAQSGFGCLPDASGRAVFGQFLIDGEKTRFNRQDFIGICDEKYLPDWAKEKLEILTLSKNQKEPQNPVMKGL
jgi:hypothetical protein